MKVRLTGTQTDSGIFVTLLPEKNSVQKALSRMANSRNGVRDQGLVHMVKHGHPKLVGWAGFVVKQGATTIREDSAVTRVAFIA